MSHDDFRIERDSMGELAVPRAALWGAQTQRAVLNFTIGGRPMPGEFIRALAGVKAAAARANAGLGLLDPAIAGAIAAAADEIAGGTHADQFPVDVFQTGSGTSTNMNVNEVVARLAATRLGRAVDPNDDVNRGQSSNDVIPTALHVAATLALREALLPALQHLAAVIARREAEFATTAKTGRTHLMDAMPLTLAQELSAWRTQVENGRARLIGCEPRLLQLAIGGTAVGTGINAHPLFGERVCAAMAEASGVPFVPSRNYFEALASQDTAAELSGQMKVVAVSLIKIANDLRWMNSGPLAGLGEIALPALQPGSSIMPGKVNPVVPEAVAMAAAQVIGNDAAVTIAAQSGSFQLNVMLPLVVRNVLESLRLLAASARALADAAIAGFTVDRARLESVLQRNPVLVTALNPLIGYQNGARIAKRAWAEGRPIRDVAAEETGLDPARLGALLDALALTAGGIRGGGGGSD